MPRIWYCTLHAWVHCSNNIMYKINNKYLNKTFIRNATYTWDSGVTIAAYPDARDRQLLGGTGSDERIPLHVRMPRSTRAQWHSITDTLTRKLTNRHINPEAYLQNMTRNGKNDDSFVLPFFRIFLHTNLQNATLGNRHVQSYTFKISCHPFGKVLKLSCSKVPYLVHRSHC